MSFFALLFSYFYEIILTEIDDKYLSASLISFVMEIYYVYLECLGVNENFA